MVMILRRIVTCTLLGGCLVALSVNPAAAASAATAAAASDTHSGLTAAASDALRSAFAQRTDHSPIERRPETRFQDESPWFPITKTPWYSENICHHAECRLAAIAAISSGLSPRHKCGEATRLLEEVAKPFYLVQERVFRVSPNPSTTMPSLLDFFETEMLQRVETNYRQRQSGDLAEDSGVESNPWNAWRDNLFAVSMGSRHIFLLEGAILSSRDEVEAQAKQPALQMRRSKRGNDEGAAEVVSWRIHQSYVSLYDLSFWLGEHDAFCSVSGRNSLAHEDVRRARDQFGRGTTLTTATVRRLLRSMDAALNFQERVFAFLRESRGLSRTTSVGQHVGDNEEEAPLVSHTPRSEESFLSPFWEKGVSDVLSWVESDGVVEEEELDWYYRKVVFGDSDEKSTTEDLVKRLVHEFLYDKELYGSIRPDQKSDRYYTIQHTVSLLDGTLWASGSNVCEEDKGENYQRNGAEFAVEKERKVDVTRTTKLASAPPARSLRASISSPSSSSAKLSLSPGFCPPARRSFPSVSSASTPMATSQSHDCRPAVASDCPNCREENQEQSASRSIPMVINRIGENRIKVALSVGASDFKRFELEGNWATLSEVVCDLELRGEVVGIGSVSFDWSKGDLSSAPHKAKEQISTSCGTWGVVYLTPAVSEPHPEPHPQL